MCASLAGKELSQALEREHELQVQREELQVGGVGAPQHEHVLVQPPLNKHACLDKHASQAGRAQAGWGGGRMLEGAGPAIRPGAGRGGSAFLRGRVGRQGVSSAG